MYVFKDFKILLNIIARIFGLLLLVELLTGYYFNMSATYFSSGHFLSATMRLIDIAKSKIEILKIDSTVKIDSTLKECDTPKSCDGRSYSIIL